MYVNLREYLGGHAYNGNDKITVLQIYKNSLPEGDGKKRHWPE